MSVTDDERWGLEDRHDFLHRSLEDLEAEFESGDIDPDDYERLKARDERLLADVDEALGQVGVPDDEDPGVDVTKAAPENPTPRRKRRRWWVGVLGGLFLLASAIVLVVAMTSKRLPGQYSSGSQNLSRTALVSQQLTQASTLLAHTALPTALGLYDKVLDEEPKQPEALSEAGWLEWQAGNSAHDEALKSLGTSMLSTAISADPGFYVAHYYLGLVDTKSGNVAGAVTEFTSFLAEHPPQGWIDEGAPTIREVFTTAHLPIPPQVR